MKGSTPAGAKGEESFKGEAAILASLDHENCLRFHGMVNGLVDAEVATNYYRSFVLINYKGGVWQQLNNFRKIQGCARELSKLAKPGDKWSQVNWPSQCWDPGWTEQWRFA